MRFGIFYEHQLPKPWADGDEEQLLADAIDQVVLADRLGIDHVWAVEHHFLEEYSHCSAPEVFLAACAARTENIRIGHGIKHTPANYNHPARVAEEIATLDLISGGRVVVTVGVGGRPMDYRAVGASFERRHARMDEQVAEMRRIWAGEPAFEGSDEVGPRPVQPGGPPILAGTLGPKATRRAAEWAQGVYMWSGNGVRAEIEQAIHQVERCWAEAGRKEEPRRVAGFWCTLAENSQERLQSYVYDYMKFLGPEFAGAFSKTMDRSSPEKINESIDAMEELGCDELFLVPATSDLQDIEALSNLVAKRR
jgi:alkanesulfonate monooxygenase SsuD/methylene tetrahydromethanopterin reductase-like flavin-dependent oxidoreductase (luciferase family)